MLKNVMFQLYFTDFKINDLTQSYPTEYFQMINFRF